jgi:hypothetical protein
MDNKKERKRWPLTLIIIAAVVIVSAVMIYSYRDAPGRIPVSAISDGSDGVIVAWQNDRGIYAQRVDPSGQPQWEAGGVFICKCPPGSGFTLTPDSLGGAIITWSDTSSRPDDRDDPAFFDPVPFYAQRINADGKLLWNDVPISTGKSRQVVADGSGGAIIAWNDYSVYYKGLQDDYLRVQKIAQDGRRLWDDEGVLVVASSPYRPITEEDIARGIKGTITRSRPTYEGIHDIVSDGAGGAIILWEEETESGQHRVCTQRLDAEGKFVWPDRVIAAYGRYYNDTAKSDGAGGAFLAFTQSETGATYQQHISSTGELLETEAYYPNSISDRLGGVIQVRVEAEPPSGPPWEKHNLLYVRRFDEIGRTVYPDKLVLTTPEEQQLHELEYVADGKGGIILAWQLRKGQGAAYGGILAQRLDAEGAICWGEKGLPVFTAPEVKYQGGAIVTGDGSGGAIIVAVVGKGALSGDMVYAQRLDKDGNRLWGSGIRIDR